MSLACALELDEEILQRVAKDGTMDYEKWPALLEPLLQRLEQIVHNEFPIPSIPPKDWLRPRQRTGPDHASTETPSLGSPNRDRVAQRPLPPVPPFNSSTSTNPSHGSDSLPPSQTPIIAESVPELLVQQFASISLTLRTDFSSYPPHPIQRLAELVLTPNKHYKTLPAWLRAVDRAVTVTSTARIFPLPQALPNPHDGLNAPATLGVPDSFPTDMGGNGIPSTNADTRDAGLGSDESLGGALLTPIPWLKNGETAGTNSPRPDTLHPVDSLSQTFVPEREDRAVTQGELIRMEQEAGIVPINQTAMADGQEESESGAERADLVPHARGPDVVGVEDMGLQDGKGFELQIGGPEPRVDEAVADPPRPAIDRGVLAGAAEREKERQEKALPTDSIKDVDEADANVETEAEDSQLAREARSEVEGI